MFMDDNARPHRARIVQHFLQQEAVQTIPWPAMSPDMNPIEHVWDFDITIFLTLLKRKDYTKCSKITNLQSVYHPERQQHSFHLT
jgi:hypothetical protein